jgi:hypothetical protein
MTKSNPDWVDIFDALGVAWCYGQDGCLEGHEGFIEQDPSGLIIHWTDRRVTRASVHKALDRIAHANRPDFEELPRWRATYLHNMEILRLAREAHVRLPRLGFDVERGKLRYMLSTYGVKERRRMTPSEQHDFKAALRWAARS